MIVKTRTVKKVKKTLVCMNAECKNVFVHSGCTCRSKCPRCGQKGSAVEWKGGKLVF